MPNGPRYDADVQSEVDAMAAISLMPDLPSEMYGVVAECLAGLHAFRTLASLNVANREIHEETLPVLFETVLMDKPRETSPFVLGKSLLDSIPVSKGCVYTKFLICQDFEISPRDVYTIDAERLLARFPKLAMILALGLPSDPISSACRIYLLQPLKAATVFGTIARTPVHHPIGPWVAPDRRSPMPSDKVLSRSFSHRPVRAVERLRQLSITETGWLLPEEPGSQADWSTSLKFEATCVRDYTEDRTHGYDHLHETIFEILRVAGRRRNDRFGLLSSRSSPPSDLEKGIRFHVVMAFSRTEFVTFVERLESAAQSNPEILRNRIKILFYGAVEREFLEHHFRAVQAIYQRHAFSANDIAPGFGPPFTLVEAGRSCYDLEFDQDGWSAYGSVEGGRPPPIARLDLRSLFTALRFDIFVEGANVDEYADWDSDAE